MSDQLGHEEDMYGLQVDGMHSGRYEQTYKSGLCGYDLTIIITITVT